MEGVTKTPRGLHCLQGMGTSSPGLVMLINSQHVSDLKQTVLAHRSDRINSAIIPLVKGYQQKPRIINKLLWRGVYMLPWQRHSTL